MPELGRYGAYVWPAYAVSALALVVAIIQTVLRARRWRRAAEREEAARGSGKPNREGGQPLD